MPGALLKMKLVGFSDSTFRSPTFFACVVQVNPESYSLSHAVNLAKEQPNNDAGSAGAFQGIQPRKLDFEVVFDATGALADAAPTPYDLATSSRAGVWPQLTLFKNTVYTYFGSSHRPPYVLVQWGTLVFPCQLESLNVTYKLFSPEGVPLRATAKVSFQEVIESTKLQAIADALSSDLTHVRTVQAGDTLPLLCHQVYGDATLYPKVASVNKLVNFRTLRVGQQLTFPPLVPAT